MGNFRERESILLLLEGGGWENGACDFCACCSISARRRKVGRFPRVAPLNFELLPPSSPPGLNPEKDISCRCVVNRVLLGVHFRSSVFGIIAVSQSKKINKTG